MGIMKDLNELEHHDKLVVVAVVLLFVGAIFMIKDLTAAETTSFIRNEVLDLAILLLLADMIVHLGRIEGKILAGERAILSEEKKIEKRVVFKKKKR
jgi:hypothetical protein